MNDKTNRTIVPDTDKATLIRKAFELYATGEYPLLKLRKVINESGLVGKRDKLLSISNYQYLLKNPIYYGAIRYGGELYDGVHEPIITKKLLMRYRASWEASRALLAHPN
ncbi:MAG: recombinase family protein [Candidatus Nomurabacteria bacterium]|nr:MAG: recombinase family protein [Candidatus Nomurabacteria bacterium]